jgi:hypothetical protein
MISFLRIAAQAIFVLVEIAAITYLIRGYDNGLLKRSPSVYLLPLVLVMPLLTGKRIATLVAGDEGSLSATPAFKRDLLILSWSAVGFAYVAVAVAISPGVSLLH